MTHTFTGVAHATHGGLSPSRGNTTATVVVGGGGGEKNAKVATLDENDKFHLVDGGENSHTATSVSSVNGIVAVAFADTDGVQLYRANPTLERAGTFHDIRLGRAALALSMDATKLCVSTPDGSFGVYMLDEAKGICELTVPCETTPRGDVAGLAWSQHIPSMFGAACDDGALHLFDTRVFPSKGVVTAPRLVGQSITTPTCLAFHPGFPDMVAAGYTLGHLAYWDLRALKEPCAPIIHAHSPCEVRCIRFCEAYKGGAVATGGGAGMICVWDFPSGRILVRLGGHLGPVAGMDFHPAQPGLLVSCAQYSTVRQWVVGGKADSLPSTKSNRYRRPPCDDDDSSDA